MAKRNNGQNRNGKKQNMNTKSYTPRNRNKKVEIDIDRDDINKADLRGKDTKYSDKNDVSWYAKNPELLAAAANFPFGYPIGVELPTVQQLNGDTIQTGSNIPGLLILPYMPTIGRSTDGSSPINLAAKLQYSNTRYANSGTTYGDPADLMMYYLAIDSMYMFHQFCVRAYGLLRTYNYMNRYYPKSIIESMGLDFDDLNANITQFWGFINTYAVKLQAFAAPADIAYFSRHSWMTSGIYLDGNSSKAQSYMYLPVGYYQWNEVVEGPNSLSVVTPYGNASSTILPSIKTGITTSSFLGKLKLADLMKFANDLMNPVLQSESFGLTTGAILKAYGADNLMKVGTIPEDYQVVPTYNAEVLSQIENATLFTGIDWITTIPTFEVTQSKGVDDMYITATPKLYSFIYSQTDMNQWHIMPYLSSVNSPTDILVNMHIENPTPADFMVATRLTATCGPATVDPSTSGDVYRCYADLEQFASEIIINPYLLTYSKSLLITAPVPNLSSMNIIPLCDMIEYNTSTGAVDPGNYQYSVTAFAAMSLLQQFDWHPAAFNVLLRNQEFNVFTRGSGADIAYTFKLDTRDIDNFAIITSDNISLLNQVAMLSLFDSPRIAELVAKPYKRA